MALKLNPKVTNMSIFNAIYAAQNQAFQDRIPKANITNMQQVATAITSQAFKAQMNEWFDTLINRVGMVIFHDYAIHNKLSKYIYGRMDFGDAIEEIATDIVKGSSVNYGEDGRSVDPFVVTSPNVKAMYHRINQPIQYCTTVKRDLLNRAFLNAGGLGRLIAMFVNKLYSSANYDSWLLTKAIMAYYINDKMAAEGVPLLPEQKVGTQDVVDQETAREFILKVKNVISAMEFPNNSFNPMKVHKTLSNRDLTLFIRSDILNVVSVDLLSAAFHQENLNLNISIEPMDNFGIDPDGNGTDGVLAVLAEDNWLLLTEQFEDLENIYNPRGRYWNYFLTRAMSFGVTYFKDAVIFSKDYLTT